MGDECIPGGGGIVQSVFEVAEKLCLAATGLHSECKKRAAVRGRAIICALAIDYLGISGRVLSRRLTVSPSAVSKLAQRGRTGP